MADRRRMQLWLLDAVLGFLEEHPRFVRTLLRPAAVAPWLGPRLMVLPRAFLGATAFEIHDVNLHSGRIGIGGVEEILTGSKLIHLLHTTLASRVGEAEKDRALYELGESLCRWEVSQALEHGRWAPAALAPLILGGRILDEVRTDPLTARFFVRTLRMMSRLITDEGGWGHLEFDVSSLPLRVTLSNSQEARWLGPSSGPVCRFYAGIVAGYAGTLAGEPMRAREVACRAAGHPACVFEVERAEGR
ncbi:MAG: 4-vinyl reductase [Deltaproteobacteria bacterium]|nr:4-vinyl reductase [Deltaproteobacteria bacterium]